MLLFTCVQTTAGFRVFSVRWGDGIKGGIKGEGMEEGGNGCDITSVLFTLPPPLEMLNISKKKVSVGELFNTGHVTLSPKVAVFPHTIYFQTLPWDTQYQQQRNIFVKNPACFSEQIFPQRVSQRVGSKPARTSTLLPQTDNHNYWQQPSSVQCAA